MLNFWNPSCTHRVQGPRSRRRPATQAIPATLATGPPHPPDAPDTHTEQAVVAHDIAESR
ncbi:hypothetical protein [Streptomyces laurentii]|uniref:hypothetical protein n=1 Tax=Streptomyces laurentii TaxID=39478 RepID=UPI0033EB8043